MSPALFADHPRAWHRPTTYPSAARSAVSRGRGRFAPEARKEHRTRPNAAGRHCESPKRGTVTKTAKSAALVKAKPSDLRSEGPIFLNPTVGEKMENERLPVISWPPKSFAHLEISAVIGLLSFICIVESSDVYAARIAFGSLVISSVVMIVSFWKFKQDCDIHNETEEA